MANQFPTKNIDIFVCNLYVSHIINLFKKKIFESEMRCLMDSGLSVG